MEALERLDRQVAELIRLQQQQNMQQQFVAELVQSQQQQLALYKVQQRARALNL